MYLIDTNVWLELLLEREHAAEVRRFFNEVESDLLAITEFSLYSIGIILTRLNKGKVFEDFLADVLEASDVMRIRLNIGDLKLIPQLQLRFRLDFDDAYQYLAAEQYGYMLISFDHDFDHTALGRKTPMQVVNE
jgi:hypothetical protein